MSAVKWHREQAARYAEQTREWEERGCSLRAGGYVDAIAHHALAADALEALAVPGVADWLASGGAESMDEDVRQAVRTLEDAAKAVRTLEDAAKEDR